MKLNILKRKITGDLVVIDSTFPQKEPFAFRNAEINEYINRVENVDSYTMYPMHGDERAGYAHAYGVDHATYLENKAGYLTYYPQNERKLHHLSPNKRYKFKLAYSFFLGETFSLLPFYDKNQIPFVFVLYPGGLLGLDSDASDYMLERLFTSKYFRGVIVTQKLTEEYLLKKKLCSAKDITYIYGGFVQFQKDEVKPKKYYKKDKKTFDICFVAAKYSEKGVDKGYDLFIESAKRLAKETDDIMFHVVGGFDKNEIDVSELKGRIKFYGYQRPDFLLNFYAKMDIILSPNRPFKLYGGNFDGFPLGNDAMYCGVALFASDELKMNRHYEEDEEVVIVPLNAKKIADSILSHYNDVERFYALAQKGQDKTQLLYDMDYQINSRLDVFKKHVNLRFKDK